MFAASRNFPRGARCILNRPACGAARLLLFHHPLIVGGKKALGQGVAAGRTQVARIVGRDTQDLSEEEIIKATVETVSENTTDGVISPLLYAAIGGPILLWGFKAASTLDSMVGYLDEKYRDIGWSSAKLDDVLNYIPARLTALLMVRRPIRSP